MYWQCSMKIIAIFLLVISSYLTSFSQLLPGETSSNKIKPRNQSDGIAGSMYGGISVKTANIFDNWGIDVGASFGGMISDHFGIGGSIYTLFTQNVRIIPGQPYFLRLNYGGLEPSFVFKFGNVAFHSKVLLGLGFAGYSENVNFDILSDLDGDWIMITEPSIGLSYIFDESIWLTLDAGWRVTSGVDFKNISAQDMNGVIFSLTLKTIIN